MADVKAKLKLTLSDSTIIESNEFTIPQGPIGPSGADGTPGAPGPAGENGKNYLYYTEQFGTSSDIPPETTIFNNSKFNRTPEVGDSFFIIVRTVANDSYWFVQYIVTAVSSNTNASAVLPFTKLDAIDAIQNITRVDINVNPEIGITLTDIDISDFSRAPINNEQFGMFVYNRNDTKTYSIYGKATSIGDSTFNFTIISMSQITGSKGSTGANGKDAPTITTCEVVEV